MLRGSGTCAEEREIVESELVEDAKEMVSDTHMRHILSGLNLCRSRVCCLYGKKNPRLNALCVERLARFVLNRNLVILYFSLLLETIISLVKYPLSN